MFQIWQTKHATQTVDDRPHPKQGDKRASKTYEAVGRALTQWEYLEAKLAELFSQLVEEWPSDGTTYHSRRPCLRLSIGKRSWAHDD
jgi:hypothetical protein